MCEQWQRTRCLIDEQWHSHKKNAWMTKESVLQKCGCAARPDQVSWWCEQTNNSDVRLHSRQRACPNCKQSTKNVATSTLQSTGIDVSKCVSSDNEPDARLMNCGIHTGRKHERQRSQCFRNVVARALTRKADDAHERTSVMWGYLVGITCPKLDLQTSIL